MKKMLLATMLLLIACQFKTIAQPSVYLKNVSCNDVNMYVIGTDYTCSGPCGCWVTNMITIPAGTAQYFPSMTMLPWSIPGIDPGTCDLTFAKVLDITLSCGTAVGSGACPGIPLNSILPCSCGSPNVSWITYSTGYEVVVY